MEEGCDGHETLCATTVTDDPGATLQQVGATWRQGEAQRYRVRVSVAPGARGRAREGGDIPPGQLGVDRAAVFANTSRTRRTMLRRVDIEAI